MKDAGKKLSCLDFPWHTHNVKMYIFSNVLSKMCTLLCYWESGYRILAGDKYNSNVRQQGYNNCWKYVARHNKLLDANRLLLNRLIYLQVVIDAITAAMKYGISINCYEYNLNIVKDY